MSWVDDGRIKRGFSWIYANGPCTTTRCYIRATRRDETALEAHTPTTTSVGFMDTVVTGPRRREDYAMMNTDD